MHICKNRPYGDAQTVAALSRHAVATVHEAMGRRGALDPKIKPVAKGMRLCGPALTVRCHSGDNLMLIKAISMALRGQVIIADMGNAAASGPFGEVLAVECVAKGVAGLVVNCGVRDTREITKLGSLSFPAVSASQAQPKRAWGRSTSRFAAADRRSGRTTSWSATTTAWQSFPAKKLLPCWQRPRRGSPRRKK